MDFLRSRILEDFSWLDHGFGTRIATDFPERMAVLRQIHSSVTLVANGPGCIGEGDALVTGTPGLAISVRTADCLPILLADARQRAVAAVHAGWRGTAAQIVQKAMVRLGENFRTDPADVCAVIGPGIGSCCYHVGNDVARQFGLNAAGQLDLADENRKQLLAAGLESSRIDVLKHCTQCDPVRFHSYRRDGEQAGRMISYIRILPQA